MTLVTEQDDYLHPPGNHDRWWTETYWFSFDDPKSKISGHFYPTLRTNLGVSGLSVMLWGPDGDAPWSCPYSRTQWHLPPPVVGKNTLELDFLKYEIIEPMTKYRVLYNDPDKYVADLEYTALAPAAALPSGSLYSGHIDQVMKVQGELILHGQKIDLDCFAMRDRSWGPRSDLENGSEAFYFYGINGSEQFLLICREVEGQMHALGFLNRDGKHAKVKTAKMERSLDDRGRPIGASFDLVDELGRDLSLRGEMENHFAMQANPHQFAWISLCNWNNGQMHGEFQEVVGRNGLARRAGLKFRG